ncbi:hypothetical protein H5123_12740 [Shewanella sp. SR43-4]|jgi:uncharacterized protein YpmB|uniref:Phage shock protein B n=1 Tax=Shewanella vesiculosa TaxID=518738 RepID=A0ABV0FSW9_9GAMM|nr:MULTISPECIES: hypothetical protein [Shewanella]NCQ45735.1 hypothetical protein [Shewanella frigidimarina]MBB1318494.1 hypothetical protein [Shewanella sp. SR43-4]MBB1322472.1 hypothetical protein [Shewanella sp. SR43-8]MBB1391037.1 hypothetical protein [Shewanella sp. SG44-6]MBB1476970.1 hypothetical protein [Shewanella sp. SG41-3]|tara:strand:+ start:1543 stop:1767 length:225 start_codon:yes stop_codon:yes gene_type:complete
MDNDIAIIALVFIVIVGTTASEMFKHYLKHKQKADADGVADIKAQNQALIERIQVLEKLVTDSDFELKQQFKKL